MNAQRTKRNHCSWVFSGVSALCLALGAGCTVEGTEGGIIKDPPDIPPGVEPYIPNPPATPTRRVVILHTNDEHSHLLGFGPNSDYPYLPDADGSVSQASVGAMATKIAMGMDQQTRGGLVRRDYLADKIRQAATDPVLTLSAGDAMMGTLFHVATPFAAPDYLAMAVMGYDFMTIGNHDFDFGPDVLSDAISMAQNTTMGGAVPIISSNMHFEDVVEDESGWALEELTGEGNSGAPITPWATKVLANGLKVGFVGLLGYEAALMAPGKSPIAFSTPADGAVCANSTSCADKEMCVRGHCTDPLSAEKHITAMVMDVQPYINLLRNPDEENVDLVIAITHLGLTEDMILAQSTTGIDVIVGGHSHDDLGFSESGYAPVEVPSQVGPGATVIVQAGAYGVLLGQLTVVVDSEGNVSWDPTETLLHEIDHTLDAEIIAGTDLLANPPVISPAFQRALELTGGVIGPVLAGLNDEFVPLLNTMIPSPIESLLDTTCDDGNLLVSSDHDILGEKPHQDSDLSHLVTDAELQSVVVAAGLVPEGTTSAKYIVAVQANGVIRETLRFGAQDNATSVADIFRTLPLGASPFQKSVPGYPMVMFQLAAGDLFAGLEVGVSRGLEESDSFFLSYSGMRVSYDEGLDPFDPDTFNPMSTDPQGRVVKIEMGNDLAGWVTIFEADPTHATPWIACWQNFDVASGDTVLVLTNLYLASYLTAFGLTPLDPYTGAEITPDVTLGSMAVMGQLILCSDLVAGSQIVTCYPNLGGNGEWTARYLEVKEWAVLLQFLTAPTALDRTIPTGMYDGDAPRVVDATP